MAWTSAGSVMSRPLISRPPLPAANLNLSFGDLLKNMNVGLMGAAEMRIGRWGFLADAMLSQVTPGGSLPGPYFS